MKLTVGQYQQLYAIAKSDAEPDEKAAQSIAVLDGITVDQAWDLPYIKFKERDNAIAGSINSLRLNTHPVSFLKANGRLYQVNYKIGTLRAGQNTELQAWLKDKDWIDNIDKILASCVVPVKKYLWVYLPGKNDSRKHEQVSEDMQAVDFSEAYGCVVFFCKLFAASIKGIQPYLESQMIANGKSRAESQSILTDLMKILDGYTTPSGWQS